MAHYLIMITGCWRPRPFKLMQSFHLKENAVRKVNGARKADMGINAIQRWHLPFFPILYKHLFYSSIAAHFLISRCTGDNLSPHGLQNEKVMNTLYYIMFDKLYLHVYLCLDPCVSCCAVLYHTLYGGGWAGENNLNVSASFYFWQHCT